VAHGHIGSTTLTWETPDPGTTTICGSHYPTNDNPPCTQVYAGAGHQVTLPLTLDNQALTFVVTDAYGFSSAAAYPDPMPTVSTSTRMYRTSRTIPAGHTTIVVTGFDASSSSNAFTAAVKLYARTSAGRRLVTTAEASPGRDLPFSVRLRRTTHFRAVYPGAEGFQGIRSPTVTVEVQPRISIRKQSRSLTGTVHPSSNGEVVWLQRHVRQGWSDVDHTTVDQTGSYLFRRYAQHQSASYRVRVAASPDHIAGVSRTVRSKQ
jgi:hypothetical protein